MVGSFPGKERGRVFRPTTTKAADEELEVLQSDRHTYVLYVCRNAGNENVCGVVPV